MYLATLLLEFDSLEECFKAIHYMMKPMPFSLNIGLGTTILASPH